MQTYSSNVQVRNQYDPSFILRFSIHILSNGIIEPVDFAMLRLLAIAFVSMSSPDLEIRKLAYETLGVLKKSLEVGNTLGPCFINLSCFCFFVYHILIVVNISLVFPR